MYVPVVAPRKDFTIRSLLPGAPSLGGWAVLGMAPVLETPMARMLDAWIVLLINSVLGGEVSS